MSNTKIKKIWKEIQEINKEIDALRPLDENLSNLLQERLRLEWTYNSNAIEGNTLTFGETSFFLREGLTSEGKPLKDFLEAKNHAEAIEALESHIREKHPITEFFIKSLHGVLMQGIEHTIAKGADGNYIHKPLHAGEYKKQPNHVLLKGGKMHHYCEPIQVPGEMEKLMEWLYSEEALKISLVERAALVHYKFVTIHPFDDGNGRISRLLMNVILMQGGFPPCIIKHKNRRSYIRCLERVRRDQDETPFLLFIAQELKESMVFMKNILLKKDFLVDPFERLSKEERKEILENAIGKKPISIGVIMKKFPSMKRSTLKKDLNELIEEEGIKTSGKGRGVVYFK